MIEGITIRELAAFRFAARIELTISEIVISKN